MNLEVGDLVTLNSNRYEEEVHSIGYVTVICPGAWIAVRWLYKSKFVETHHGGLDGLYPYEASALLLISKGD